MAIARNGFKNGGAYAQSASADITISGDNRILFVVAETYDGRTVSSVTHDGTALTRIGTPYQVSTSSGNVYISVYYLIAPATGTKTITVTLDSDGTWCFWSAVAYTGVKQTNPIEDNKTNKVTSAGSSYTVSLTPSTPGAWGFLGHWRASSLTPGTNTNQVIGGDPGSFDTNGYKLSTFTMGGTNNLEAGGGIGICFAPSEPIITFKPKINFF